MIEIKGLVELILVVLCVKLVVKRYKPPFQESIQAIICIGFGVIIGLLIDFSIEGFITSIIGSGFAFYGGDLVQEFKTVKSSNDEISIIKNKSIEGKK